MELTTRDIERYNRQLLLDEIGIDGQEKLKGARVLVIGAGGLGSPVLLYLASAGIGHISIADHDQLDLTNLQRQILFNESHIGRNKAIVATQVLRSLNSDITIAAISEGISTNNALMLFDQHDIIVDGTDNFSTRYLICDASIITEKPVVFGAIHKFEGQVTVFNFDGGPTYRCLFPTPPKEEKVQNCNEVGVIGVLPGIIGSLMANEVIKLVTGIQQVLKGQFFTFNAKSLQTMTFTHKRNQKSISELGLNRSNFITKDYQLLCEFEVDNPIEEVDPQGFVALLDNKSYMIVDVREAWEKPEMKCKNLVRISLKNVDYFVPEDDNCTYILVCQSGIRSLKAAKKLKLKYPELQFKHLRGGINDL